MLLSNTEGFTCTGAYPDCSNLVEMLTISPCDVALMDIEMPGINGIEATRQIRQHFPGTDVLIQTVFAEDEHIFNAICAGAAGYILKSTSPQDFLSAIRDVQSGGSPMTPGIARRVLQLFQTNLQPVPAADAYNLTNQEKKVLQLLVGGKSYKLIAADLFISVDTVKTHVRNIYSKLQVHSGTEAVAKAIRDKIV